jgi:uroporphyrinogen-III decarboxylase
MSFYRGWQAIHLEMPDRIPHTEYLSHRLFIMKVTGLDPEDPIQSDKAISSLAKVLDYDFIWSTFSRDWKLPKTEMGRAQYYETEIPYDSIYPFKSVEEVLAFRPLEKANIPTMEELTSSVIDYYKQGTLKFPEAVLPGGFYNSVFTWNIVTFGWDLFLMAAKDDQRQFEIILDQFTALTMMVVEAHINAKVPVFLCHDDIVWASGPVFSPAWMREMIFPRLKKMWQPLRDAGIKVLFCSDGNFDCFLDDIVEIGADGFIFEPLTDLRSIVEKYGQTHVIIGNIDSRILQFGTFEDIEQEVKRCANLGKNCPGYFFAVGNHIPYTIPIPNVECYLEAIHKYGKR